MTSHDQKRRRQKAIVSVTNLLTRPLPNRDRKGAGCPTLRISSEAVR
jgi:hypothetical protein